MFDGSVHPSGEAAKPEGDEEEEDAPIDMAFPTDSPAKMIIYILSFPLMAPLYVTLPDTKNNEFTIFPSLKIPGKRLCLFKIICSNFSNCVCVLYELYFSIYFSFYII